MGLTPEQRAVLFRYDRKSPVAKTVSVAEADGVRVERFTFQSTHGQQVPAVLYQPLGGPARPPVVLVGHGAGSSKDDPVMRPLFEHWAQAGIACLSIDSPFHGERAERVIDPTALLMRPFSGLHFVVQNAVDLMHAVDWVETRKDLDASRLGYVGFSMGTILGVQFVAMEQRVRAAVFALGGAGLLHYFAAQAPVENRSDHNMVAEACDPMHYAPLIAPRPVLMVNGLKDEIIPPVLGHVLYNSLREPRRAIWYEGGHGEIPHEHIHEMRKFLEGALRPD
jgi:dipeptidyl aminopeptidase/acylaminoacyl peptidase